MQSLIQRKQLNRVVVDEAHIAVLSQSYRECMVQLKSASRFGTACPVVLFDGDGTGQECWRPSPRHVAAACRAWK